MATDHYKLTRDGGAGIYTVRSLGDIARGRIARTLHGYRATRFPNPTIFAGEDLGTFPTRRDAAEAILARHEEAAR